MKVMNKSGTICIDVTVPGLLGRAIGLLTTPVSPPPAEGILLKGSRVHTFGMRYPIDVVHLDPRGRVLEIRTLIPNRLGPRARGTRSVLELAAGEASRMGVEQGIRLMVDKGDCR